MFTPLHGASRSAQDKKRAELTQPISNRKVDALRHVMGFTIRGTVIQGRGYGRKIGFPTINLARGNEHRPSPQIPEGVYAGTAERKLTGEKFKAAIVIAPKNKRGLPPIEAYLLNFSGDIYGETVTLTAIKRLRRFMQFASEDALKAQIAKDITRIAPARSRATQKTASRKSPPRQAR